MNKIIKLQNTIQKYDWGSKEYISQLLGNPSPSSGPEAELWMGAHPNAPSTLIMGKKRLSLLDYIKNDPLNVLGSYTSTKFNNSLPFLFKVLSAQKPLSIQAHPNKKQAKHGFKNENKKQIPPTDPRRVYKDNNHKPEIICALTPFIALNGFRPIKNIIESLESIESTALKIIINYLKQNSDEVGLKYFFKMLMTLPAAEKKQIIKDIISHTESKTDNDQKKKWILLLHREYPEDIGIISMFLLNFIQLEPGEAMYLPARQLHSYIHGNGIELMANSDNVLRGGLTPKHIDIPELLNIINFKENKIDIIRPEINEQHEKIYTTPTEEFLLSSITLTNNITYTSSKTRSVEILLCIDGMGHITELPSQAVISFHKGNSFLIPAELSQYTINGSAHLFKATVPLF